MIFADKLIALRKKAGWSQEELAQQLNVSRQSVSKWEGAVRSRPRQDRPAEPRFRRQHGLLIKG